MSIEYSAYESALDRFVHLDKGEFIGRDALIAGKAAGYKNRFVTLEVLGVTPDWSDARGSEPVYHDGKQVGRVTTGGYGWRTGKSIALAMVPPALGEVGQKLGVVILGKLHEAVVVEESPFDPQNACLRA
jgi:dimethylglycine dehydrogenase